MSLIFKERMIFVVNLGLRIGNEPAGRQNILLLSNISENCFIGAIVVENSSLTSDNYKVNIERCIGVKENSSVLLDNIYTIDKSRVVGFYGMIDREYMPEIKNKIADIFCLSYNRGLDKIIESATNLSKYEYHYNELKRIKDIPGDILTLAKARFEKEFNEYKTLCIENNVSMYKYYKPIYKKSNISTIGKGMWG